ncbi:nuclear transport factor 2 family protein [Nonomuraea mesophila]|uniref:Nuclear transport factor 2 family protein n=1 Tax=Nonomuraea mesophila TaxID=2530382 RepID=A0A4R5FV30_9ACTN|nr:nuclear transport factor 2 family protein [Nonomuraea mesophila]TDE57168.1 nuclear transport factor 2 family protein [Nonomuraea mesophila]
MVQPRSWIEGYVRAWNSNDPDDIAALFTENAVYYAEPYSSPWQGRDAIVSEWLARQDKPGEATFEWHPVCVTDEVSVVQGVTTYPDKTYSNLWVIRFVPDGRCREFTEWWMLHDVK